MRNTNKYSFLSNKLPFSRVIFVRNPAVTLLSNYTCGDVEITYFPITWNDFNGSFIPLRVVNSLLFVNKIWNLAKTVLELWSSYLDECWEMSGELHTYTIYIYIYKTMTHTNTHTHTFLKRWNGVEWVLVEWSDQSNRLNTFVDKRIFLISSRNENIWLNLKGKCYYSFISSMS
jgi:hypothetical protein